MQKTYEQLEFTDNFLFVKILSSHPDICREMLELILNKKIKSLKMQEYEYTFLPKYESRGIRMDVYTEDEEGVAYDIEMQAQPDAHIAKRSRYYHSVMDMEQLTKGTEYHNLKKSFVIFICKEKIADGLDKPIYTFRFRSNEDPNIYLNDDIWTIFVNACCNTKDISPETRAFLNYIRTGNADEPADSLASRIDRLVKEAKAARRWSTEYMRWEDEIKYQRFLIRQEMQKQMEEDLEKALAKLSEETKQQTEEAKQLAEDAKRQAEESRQQAEESRRQAEESRRQAEESRRQAEESRRQAEESRRQAKEADSRARKALEELQLYKEKFGELP